MGYVTKDKDKLMTRWMKLYMNLMIIRSRVSSEQKHIDEMRDKLAEMNEYMMGFFDAIGANPEEAD